MRISDWSSDVVLFRSDDTLVHMWRADAKMLVVHVRDTRAQDLRYDVGIYTNGEQPLSMTTVDQLVDGLRLSVQPIPSATFTIMKRSEEHTSELQSLMRISYAVFCLKKKKTKKNHMTQLYYQ